MKISITLPQELLVQIDKEAESRSEFLERAARQYLAKMERVRREEKDAEIYEREMDRLNAEALDAIAY